MTSPAFEYTGEATDVTQDGLAKDFFPTPLPVVRSGTRAVRLTRAPEIILDPAAGNTGRWGLLAKERWQPRLLMGAELRDVPQITGFNQWHTGDFLEYIPDPRPDLIITNPPFSIWEWFVDHGLDVLSERGALILFVRVQCLGGRERYLHFYPRQHLKHVYYLASRVAFIKKRDPDTGRLRPVADVWDYCLLEFDRQRHEEPTLSWWDYKNTPMKPRSPRPPALPEYTPTLLQLPEVTQPSLL